MGQLTIKKLDESDANQLYVRYDQQTQPQKSYIELDCETGEMIADYNGEIGNAVPESVWHNRRLRWYFPSPPTAKTANKIMEQITPLAQRVLAGYDTDYDNQTNRQGHLADDAQRAADKIGEILTDSTDEKNSVNAISAEDWLAESIATNSVGIIIDGVGTVTEDSTDEALKKMSDQISKDAASEGYFIDDDIEQYLKRRLELHLDSISE